MASFVVTICGYDCSISYSSIHEEINADQNAVRYGYKDELWSVLTKVAKSSKIKAAVKYTGGGRFQDLVHMSVAMINNIRIRKFYLAMDLLAKIKLYHTSLFWNHWFGFFKILEADYSNGGLFHEEVVDKIEDELNEEYTTEFTLITKKLDRIDPTMLDYITIKVDGIENNDDKMLILTYIHSKLDLIEYYIHVAENPGGLVKTIVPHSLSTLQGIKKQLLMLREKALNTKVKKITYGINIGYPEGYEG